MNIDIANNQSSLNFSSSSIRPIVEQVLKNEDCSCDEISINFVDQATICQLHLDYFNDPSPTDCITIPIDEEEESCYRLLGEIFICPQAAIDYVASHQGDVYLELTLYLVHGLLHLLGYDDIDPCERKLMRKAEERHMQNLITLKLTIKES